MELNETNIYKFLKTLKYIIPNNKKFNFGTKTENDIKLFNNIKDFAPAIPNIYLINHIKNFVKKNKVLEIEAKRGLWTFLLKIEKMNVIGTTSTNNKYFSKIINNYIVPPLFTSLDVIDPINAVIKYDPQVLLSVWSNQKELQFESLAHFKGDKLIFIGEKMDKPDYLIKSTGSEEFHQLILTDWILLNEFEYDQFYGVHDKMYFYERKNNLINKIPTINKLLKLMFNYGPDNKSNLLSKNQELYQHKLYQYFIFDCCLTSFLIDKLIKYLNKAKKIIIFNDSRGILPYLFNFKKDKYTVFVPRENIIKHDIYLDKYIIPKSYSTIFEMNQSIRLDFYDTLIINNHLSKNLDENNLLLMIYQLMKTEYKLIIYFGHDKDYYAGRTLKKIIEEKYYLLTKYTPPYFANFELAKKSEIIIYTLNL